MNYWLARLRATTALLVLLSASASAFSKNVVFRYASQGDERIPANVTVNSVSVAGSFNDWNRSSHPLVQQPDGSWSGAFRLPGGLHYYKFVINDRIWLEDRNAEPSLRRDDGTGQGNFNAGIEVKERGEDHGAPVAGGVLLAAVRHDPAGADYRALEPGRVLIRLRVRTADVSSATILVEESTSVRRVPMERIATSDGFDFYEAEIRVTTQQADLKYRFELTDGPEPVIYQAPGEQPFVGFTGFVSQVPEWAREAIWYQVFPERFRNGDPSNDPRIEEINEGEIPGWKLRSWGSDWYAMDEWERANYGSVFPSIFRRRYGGDLQGLIEKLDYIQSLGANAIYLNPIFRSPSLHKYDGSSFHHIEETFGPDPEGDRRLIEAANETEDPATWIWTSADRLFLELVKEVHRRKMRIIIDGVFNHSGRTFFAFQDLLKNRRTSRYTSWYNITKWDDALPEGFDYKGWFGMKYLPEFRRDEAGVDAGYQRYVYDITRRWMAPQGRVENGVDGWRLDVAFCLPHGFWKAWRRHVKGINPEAYITGEVVEIAPDYLRGDEFDGLMNYPFAYCATEFFIDRARRVPPSVFDRRLAEVRDAYPAEITRVMQNLYSSHDSPRLSSLIVNPDMNYRDFGGHFERSKVEKTHSYRIDRGDAADRATHKLMATFQMTYIGAPMIYYGNEVGMTGANDPDCRKPMLWEDISYVVEQVHPVAGRTRPAEQNEIDRDLLEHYRKMIRLRREQPALSRGTYETILVDDAANLFGYARALASQRILVIINNDAVAHEATIPAAEAGGATFTDLLEGSRVAAGADGLLRVRIPPRSAAILKRDS